MYARQPTFFRHPTGLYALFPGSPHRGEVDPPRGYWQFVCTGKKPKMKAMAFQVTCHAVANFSSGLAGMAKLDKHAIKFSCTEKRKHELRAILVSAWFGGLSFDWEWVEGDISIPEDATWLPHPAEKYGVSE